MKFSVTRRYGLSAVAKGRIAIIATSVVVVIVVIFIVVIVILGVPH
jgi:hypothetical protein